MSTELDERYEANQTNRITKATNALLGRLHEHHDFGVIAPKDWKPKRAIPIVAYEEEPESIEVCVLPIVGGKPTVDAIKRVVCRQYGLTHNEIISTRRDRKVARPRQIAMYLCKEKTSLSFPEIGRRFGGKDHTTVIHATRTVKILARKDWLVAYDVAQLEAQL